MLGFFGCTSRHLSLSLILRPHQPSLLPPTTPPILPEMAPSKKLTEDNEAISHLCIVFDAQKITDKEKSKSFHNMENIFQEHNLLAFRFCYNRTRQEILGAMHDLNYFSLHFFEVLFAYSN